MSPLSVSSVSSSTGSSGSGGSSGTCQQSGKRGFVDVGKAQPALPTNTGPCLVFDDLDGDGIPELVVNAVVEQKSSKLLIYQQSGGQWLVVKTLLDFATSKPVSCFAGDIDNDGRTDLVVATLFSGETRLFHNAGKLVFNAVPDALPALELKDVRTSDALFDYDNDGLLDYMIGRFADAGNTDVTTCQVTATDFFCASKTPMKTAEAVSVKIVAA